MIGYKMVIDGKKTCSNCGKTKVAEEGFGKNKSTKDGYQRWCKKCRNLVGTNQCNGLIGVPKIFVDFGFDEENFIKEFEPWFVHLRECLGEIGERSGRGNRKNSIIQSIIKYCYTSRDNLFKDIDSSEYATDTPRRRVCLVEGCGWIGKQTPNHVIHGTGCPRCLGHEPYTVESLFVEFHDLVSLPNGVSCESKGVFKCFRDVTHPNYLQTFNNHRKGSRCPVCAQQYNVTEKRILDGLNSLTTVNWEEMRIKAGDRWMQWDCVNRVHRQIIEIHGRQHYEDVSEWHSRVLDVQSNDNVKRNWAIKNNWELWVHPHRDGFIPGDEEIRAIVVGLIRQIEKKINKDILVSDYLTKTIEFKNYSKEDLERLRVAFEKKNAMMCPNQPWAGVCGKYWADCNACGAKLHVVARDVLNKKWLHCFACKNKRISVPVIGQDKDSGIVFVFSGQNEASQRLKCFSSNIRKCCKGQKNSAYGYHWWYAKPREGCPICPSEILSKAIPYPSELPKSD